MFDYLNQLAARVSTTTIHYLLGLGHGFILGMVAWAIVEAIS